MGFIVILFITLKNIIYGLSIFFTGNLTDKVDVLSVLSLRFLMSFVVLFFLKTFKVIKIEVGVKDIFTKTKNSEYMSSLLLAGLFEPVLYMFFETMGVSMTTGITAGVILALAPIFCCIAEIIFLKEKNSLMQKVFLAVGIIGVIYIAINTATSDGKNTLSGILFMLGAVVSGALFCVFSRKSGKHFRAFEVTYISCMMGTVIFNAINIIIHLKNGNIVDYFKPYFDIDNLIGFLYLAVLSTIIATAMSNYTLAKAKVSSLAAFGGVSTLVTVFADVVFNNESLYYYHIIGIALIFVRIIGVTVIDIKKDKQKAKTNSCC